MSIILGPRFMAGRPPKAQDDRWPITDFPLSACSAPTRSRSKQLHHPPARIRTTWMSLVPFVTESLGQLERQEFLISLHDCVPLTLALIYHILEAIAQHRSCFRSIPSRKHYLGSTLQSPSLPAPLPNIPQCLSTQGLPNTPKRANDGVEKLKQSLSAKWGITLPLRDSTWSPSRRDPNRPEEQISTRLHFLYYKGEAAKVAIEQFEKQATKVFSKWQYKPQADPDVLPSRESSTSILRRDFLQRREEVPPAAVKELTQTLLHHLVLISNRVKAGEKFAHIAETEDAKPSVEEYPPMKVSRTHSQSTLSQYFRNKSAPGGTASPAATSNHPSSDDYPDSDMADIMADPDLMDIAYPPVPTTAVKCKNAASGQTSPADEEFETPPTSPSHPTTSNVGLGITKAPNEPLEQPATSLDRQPQDSRGSSIWRQQPLVNTDVFDKIKSSVQLTNISRKRPCVESEPMKPPPKRFPSHERQSLQGRIGAAIPTPPPDNHPFMSRSLSSTRSFDDISVSSSFTSHSPAWTSPNTSFCADSMATSFDSAVDETDTTMRPSIALSRSRHLREPAWLSSRLEKAASDQTSDVDKTSTTWLSFSTDSMDVDTDEAPKHRNIFQPGNRLDPTRNDANRSADQSGKLGNIQGCTEVKADLPEVSYSKFVPKSIEQDDKRKQSVKPTIGEALSTLNVQGDFLKRLIANTPFVSLPKISSDTPIRQIYEIFRVSTACNVPLGNFSDSFSRIFEDYDQLWSCLSSTVANSNGPALPERSSLAAWNRAGESFEGVSVAGKFKVLDQSPGPVFELTLSPLKMEPSYRLARKFGHDRFCVIGLPGLGSDSLPAYLKHDHIAARETIIKWLVEIEHHFLGRVWRVFFVKPESTRKKQKSVKVIPNDSRFRVHFFAVDGFGFKRDILVGETDPRRSNHAPVTIKELLEWFMSSEVNQKQPCLKFFSRIGLGLTNTTATIEFTNHDIIRCHDAFAHSPSTRRLNLSRSERIKSGRSKKESESSVMNDGCARISKDAAVAVANMLGMEQAPSAFQGRIGGAKGIWMVDALDERPARLPRRPDGKAYWIEITDSQLKFNPHPRDAIFPDKCRVTFEVNKYSKRLTPSSLNYQLMPILENRGVPQDVFIDLLRADLSSRVSEMEVAMDDGLALRKWNQENNPVTTERAHYGGIEMMGGLPESSAEKINWFFEHGFEPKTCLYLKDLLWKAIKAYCLRLENRMNIGLGQSTTAFMIADPLNVLEEGEIHLGFSGMFRDPISGFDENMLHDMDVLVARLPAHLPSDIQKVRAVFKPELRVYRDVVVFSSKGEVSLASKLSGGDYDGDTAWICWEPNIVRPFQNAPVPPVPSLESYGIEKDTTRVSDLLPHEDYTNQFLRHAFNFNLQMNMLGTCTIFHETLCYHQGAIDSPAAINIGMLLGNLVDSAKGGFKFDESKWVAYLKRMGLTKKLNPPAYKDRNKARPKQGNLIDYLVFHVAKEEREAALKKFTEHFQGVGSWDEDLVRIRSEEVEEAKRDRLLDNVLINLKAGLDEIMTYWKTHAKRDEDDEDIPQVKRGSGLSFRAVAEKCRHDFLALAPRSEESANTGIGTAPTKKSIQSTLQRNKFQISLTAPSDTILRWQRAHAASNSSHWDLLKASVAFYHFHKTNFVWYMAGIELGEIKAMAKGRGMYRVIPNRMFDVYKLDNKAAEGARRREEGRVEAEEVEEEDEFGDPDPLPDLGML